MVARSAIDGRPALAACRSQAKNAMAAAAIGTYRALTSPWSSRSATIEPTPTPTAKSASISVTTCSLAKRTSLANAGSPDTTVAPNSQNQDTARIGNNSAGRDVTCPTTAIVSRRRCGRGASGAEDGAGGIWRAASQPRRALRTPQLPTMSAPLPCSTTLPPRIVPRRIARNVPASMRAFPATSSSSRRCCGSNAYLIGPKTVECVPRQKSAAKRSGTLFNHRPTAPRVMMAISASFTTRAIRDLSMRSASVPDAPEKRKNGAMKTAPASMTSEAELSPDSSARRNVTTMPMALFSRLSLKAPRNCVTKSGANRRAVKS